MPSDKQATERLDNLSAIIKVIRSKGHITRRELASRLSLSWGCISELIGMLVADGTVIEEKLPPSDAKGRIPSILTLSDCKKILGVDINKTGLSCCVCSLAGENLYECNSSLSTDSKGELLRDVFSSVTKMQNKFPDICISGFAMQGIKDADSGCWSFSNNIKINFENDIASHLNISAVVEHDPNCMLLGCMDDESKESKMLVRIDRGIGAAIYRSNGSFDGGLLELGYTSVGGGKRLFELSDVSYIDGLSADEREKALTLAGEQLGIALGNFCNMISLDEIIVCGEITKYEDIIIPSIEKSYGETVIKQAAAKITVKNIRNAAFGAARLAIEAYPYVLKRKSV